MYDTTSYSFENSNIVEKLVDSVNIDKCIFVSKDAFESNHKNNNVFFDKDPALWICNEMNRDHFVVHDFHQNKDVDLS